MTTNIENVAANTEDHVVALSVEVSELKLLALAQLYYRNELGRPPLKETMTFIDARGKATEVTLFFCYSFEVPQFPL